MLWAAQEGLLPSCASFPNQNQGAVMDDYLILTSGQRPNGSLNLFVGNVVKHKDYEVDIRQQILWLRMLMTSVDRYLEKNV